ncbi:hypothetical protein [Mycolicibacterium sp. S2-37]|uniref:hypothetical protein n=1 Tax=Mycolicibacterium sp. S2-37 TaxID=2810297 RepID=UPI001F5E6152|nr:hypothetical protein [Mycolicibacterium sp. S2-37]
MSSDDQEQSGAERNASTNVADDPDAKITEKPEVTDKHREVAKEMRKEYEEERPTIVMPGTGGTVAGTAVNEWVDENGDPKFGKDGEGAGEGEGAEESSNSDSGAAQAQS